MPEKSPVNAENLQSDDEYTNEATPDKPTGKIYLTAEKDEALISAIKDRPVIWDPFHPYYKNVNQFYYFLFCLIGLFTNG